MPTFPHIPLGDVALCRANLKAQSLADSANVAYWSERNYADVGYHRAAMLDALKSIADVLGYTLTPVDDDAEIVARVMEAV